MYLFIFVKFALSLNIGLYRIFVTMTTDSVDIVPFGPELSAPKLILHLRVKLENLFGRDALDCFYDLGWAHHRYTLDQKMNMVFVGPYFDKLDLISLRNLKADIFQTLINSLAKNNPSILGWANKVVEKN